MREEDEVPRERAKLTRRHGEVDLAREIIRLSSTGGHGWALL